MALAAGVRYYGTAYHERRLLVGLHDHAVLAVLAVLASRLVSFVLPVPLVAELDQLLV